MLKRRDKTTLKANRTQAFDNATLATVRGMLEAIEKDGDAAIRSYAIKFGEISADESFVVDKTALKAAFDALPEADQGVLTRTAERICAFAQAQRDCLLPLKLPVNGGFVGHDFLPVEVAGCYAPGGRFPLPSSVLMTAIPARVAGVDTVIVASPNPTMHTLAAAFVAGADIFLKLGGAQAIGALAYGTSTTPAAHIVCGPGNRWVTAAKLVISAHTGIDMLAGPSELVVLADSTANPCIIAADLLAQAEHDDDALPILVCTDDALIDTVNAEIANQLANLPTKATATAALDNGFAIYAKTLDDAIDICNILAPEHLQVLTADAQNVSAKLHHTGGLFIGAAAAEVIGDYGAGPNHTLPTGGTARFKAGLSVMNFLRARTWIDITDASKTQSLYADAVALGRMEGLEGHARAAATRLKRG